MKLESTIPGGTGRDGFSQNDAKTNHFLYARLAVFRVPSRKHWARWNSVPAKNAAGSFPPERGSCPPKSKNPRISVQNLSISRFQVGLLDFLPTPFVQPFFKKSRSNWVLFKRDSLCQETRLYKYYVEATCNGVKSATVPLCRPKKAWSYLVPCDPYQIDFKVRTLISENGGMFLFDLGIFEEGERPARGDSLLFFMFIGID